MNRPILITGAPRSGKTMIANIMDICGVFTGEVDHMMENTHIRDYMERVYLSQQRCDPHGIIEMPDTVSLPIQRGWKERTETVLLDQGYDDRQKWMYKSHGIAPMWPVWQHAFPNARYIIVRRHTDDIVRSCMQTDYIRGYSDEDGWKMMVRRYEERFVEMISEGLDCKVIWPHRMAHGDYAQIYELLEWLGLPWKTKILTEIDPKFWKVRKNETQ